MSVSYYLWSGIGAIEDLEDCTTREQAFAALDAQGKHMDWTLWERHGFVARLIGVSTICTDVSAHTKSQSDTEDMLNIHFNRPPFNGA